MFTRLILTLVFVFYQILFVRSQCDSVGDSFTFETCFMTPFISDIGLTPGSTLSLTSNALNRNGVPLTIHTIVPGVRAIIQLDPWVGTILTHDSDVEFSSVELQGVGVPISFPMIQVSNGTTTLGDNTVLTLGPAITGISVAPAGNIAMNVSEMGVVIDMTVPGIDNKVGIVINGPGAAVDLTSLGPRTICAFYNGVAGNPNKCLQIEAGRDVVVKNMLFDNVDNDNNGLGMAVDMGGGSIAMEDCEVRFSRISVRQAEHVWVESSQFNGVSNIACAGPMTQFGTVAAGNTAIKISEVPSIDVIGACRFADVEAGATGVSVGNYSMVTIEHLEVMAGGAVKSGNAALLSIDTESKDVNVGIIRIPTIEAGSYGVKVQSGGAIDLGISQFQVAGNIFGTGVFVNSTYSAPLSVDNAVFGFLVGSGIGIDYYGGGLLNSRINNIFNIYDNATGIVIAGDSTNFADIEGTFSVFNNGVGVSVDNINALVIFDADITQQLDTNTVGVDIVNVGRFTLVDTANFQTPDEVQISCGNFRDVADGEVGFAIDTSVEVYDDCVFGSIGNDSAGVFVGTDSDLIVKFDGTIRATDVGEGNTFPFASLVHVESANSVVELRDVVITGTVGAGNLYGFGVLIEEAGSVDIKGTVTIETIAWLSYGVCFASVQAFANVDVDFNLVQGGGVYVVSANPATITGSIRGFDNNGIGVRLQGSSDVIVSDVAFNISAPGGKGIQISKVGTLRVTSGTVFSGFSDREIFCDAFLAPNFEGAFPGVRLSIEGGAPNMKGSDTCEFASPIPGAGVGVSITGDQDGIVLPEFWFAGVDLGGVGVDFDFTGTGSVAEINFLNGSKIVGTGFRVGGGNLTVSNVEVQDNTTGIIGEISAGEMDNVAISSTSMTAGLHIESGTGYEVNSGNRVDISDIDFDVVDAPSGCVSVLGGTTVLISGLIREVRDVGLLINSPNTKVILDMSVITLYDVDAVGVSVVDVRNMIVRDMLFSGGVPENHFVWIVPEHDVPIGEPGLQIQDGDFFIKGNVSWGNVPAGSIAIDLDWNNIGDPNPGYLDDWSVQNVMSGGVGYHINAATTALYELGNNPWSILNVEAGGVGMKVEQCDVVDFMGILNFVDVEEGGVGLLIEKVAGVAIPDTPFSANPLGGIGVEINDPINQVSVVIRSQFSSTATAIPVNIINAGYVHITASVVFDQISSFDVKCGHFGSVTLANQGILFEQSANIGGTCSCDSVSGASRFIHGIGAAVDLTFFGSILVTGDIHANAVGASTYGIEFDSGGGSLTIADFTVLGRVYSTNFHPYGLYVWNATNVNVASAHIGEIQGTPPGTAWSTGIAIGDGVSGIVRVEHYNVRSIEVNGVGVAINGGTYVYVNSTMGDFFNLVKGQGFSINADTTDVDLECKFPNAIIEDIGIRVHTVRTLRIRENSDFNLQQKGINCFSVSNTFRGADGQKSLWIEGGSPRIVGDCYFTALGASVGTYGVYATGIGNEVQFNGGVRVLGTIPANAVGAHFDLPGAVDPFVYYFYSPVDVEGVGVRVVAGNFRTGGVTVSQLGLISGTGIGYDIQAGSGRVHLNKITCSNIATGSTGILVQGGDVEINLNDFSLISNGAVGVEVTGGPSSLLMTTNVFLSVQVGGVGVHLDGDCDVELEDAYTGSGKMISVTTMRTLTLRAGIDFSASSGNQDVVWMGNAGDCPAGETKFSILGGSPNIINAVQINDVPAGGVGIYIEGNLPVFTSGIVVSDILVDGVGVVMNSTATVQLNPFTFGNVSGIGFHLAEGRTFVGDPSSIISVSGTGVGVLIEGAYGIIGNFQLGPISGVGVEVDDPGAIVQIFSQFATTVTGTGVLIREATVVRIEDSAAFDHTNVDVECGNFHDVGMGEGLRINNFVSGAVEIFGTCQCDSVSDGEFVFISGSLGNPVDVSFFGSILINQNITNGFGVVFDSINGSLHIADLTINGALVDISFGMFVLDCAFVLVENLFIDAILDPNSMSIGVVLEPGLTGPASFLNVFIRTSILTNYAFSIWGGTDVFVNSTMGTVVDPVTNGFYIESQTVKVDLECKFPHSDGVGIDVQDTGTLRIRENSVFDNSNNILCGTFWGSDGEKSLWIEGGSPRISRQCVFEPLGSSPGTYGVFASGTGNNLWFDDEISVYGNISSGVVGAHFDLPSAGFPYVVYFEVFGSIRGVGLQVVDGPLNVDGANLAKVVSGGVGFEMVGGGLVRLDGFDIQTIDGGGIGFLAQDGYLEIKDSTFSSITNYGVGYVINGSSNVLTENNIFVWVNCAVAVIIDGSCDVEIGDVFQGNYDYMIEVKNMRTLTLAKGIDFTNATGDSVNWCGNVGDCPPGETKFSILGGSPLINNAVQMNDIPAGGIGVLIEGVGNVPSFTGGIEINNIVVGGVGVLVNSTNEVDLWPFTFGDVDGIGFVLEQGDMVVIGDASSSFNSISGTGVLIEDAEEVSIESFSFGPISGVGVEVDGRGVEVEIGSQFATTVTGTGVLIRKANVVILEPTADFDHTGVDVVCGDFGDVQGGEHAFSVQGGSPIVTGTCLFGDIDDYPSVAVYISSVNSVSFEDLQITGDISAMSVGIYMVDVVNFDVTALDFNVVNGVGVWIVDSDGANIAGTMSTVNGGAVGITIMGTTEDVHLGPLVFNDVVGTGIRVETPQANVEIDTKFPASSGMPVNIIEANSVHLMPLCSFGGSAPHISCGDFGDVAAGGEVAFSIDLIPPMDQPQITGDCLFGSVGENSTAVFVTSDAEFLHDIYISGDIGVSAIGVHFDESSTDVRDIFVNGSTYGQAVVMEGAGGGSIDIRNIDIDVVEESGVGVFVDCQNSAEFSRVRVNRISGVGVEIQQNANWVDIFTFESFNITSTGVGVSVNGPVTVILSDLFMRNSVAGVGVELLADSSAFVQLGADCLLEGLSGTGFIFDGSGIIAEFGPNFVSGSGLGIDIVNLRFMILRPMSSFLLNGADISCGNFDDVDGSVVLFDVQGGSPVIQDECFFGSFVNSGSRGVSVANSASVSFLDKLHFPSVVEGSIAITCSGSVVMSDADFLNVAGTGISVTGGSVDVQPSTTTTFSLTSSTGVGVLLDGNLTLNDVDFTSVPFGASGIIALSGNLEVASSLFDVVNGTAVLVDGGDVKLLNCGINTQDNGVGVDVDDGRVVWLDSVDFSGSGKNIGCGNFRSLSLGSVDLVNFRMFNVTPSIELNDECLFGTIEVGRTGIEIVNTDVIFNEIIAMDSIEGTGISIPNGGSIVFEELFSSNDVSTASPNVATLIKAASIERPLNIVLPESLDFSVSDNGVLVQITSNPGDFSKDLSFLLPEITIDGTGKGFVLDGNLGGGGGDVTLELLNMTMDLSDDAVGVEVEIGEPTKSSSVSVIHSHFVVNGHGKGFDLLVDSEITLDIPDNTFDVTPELNGPRLEYYNFLNSRGHSSVTFDRNYVDFHVNGSALSTELYVIDDFLYIDALSQADQDISVQHNTFPPATPDCRSRIGGVLFNVFGSEYDSYTFFNNSVFGCESLRSPNCPPCELVDHCNDHGSCASQPNICVCDDLWELPECLTCPIVHRLHNETCVDDVCVQDWYGPLCDRCDVRHPMNPPNECIKSKCSDDWFGENCTDCLVVHPFDILICDEGSCSQNWYSTHCDLCAVVHRADMADCLENVCADSYIGRLCDVCPVVHPGIVGECNSSDCLNNWNGANCSNCDVVHRDRPSFCIEDECLDNWQGTNCDQCLVDHRRDTSQCVEGDCIDDWEGVNCDSCSVVRPSDPLECVFDDCVDDWEGHLCTKCDVVHRVSNDTCLKGDCSDRWEGDECDDCHTIENPQPGTCESEVCIQGYFGDDCDLIRCFDLFSDDVNICGGHGVCECVKTTTRRSGQPCVETVCDCENGWDTESDDCSVPDKSFVQSSNGIITFSALGGILLLVLIIGSILFIIGCCVGLGVSKKKEVKIIKEHADKELEEQEDLDEEALVQAEILKEEEEKKKELEKLKVDEDEDETPVEPVKIEKEKLVRTDFSMKDKKKEEKKDEKKEEKKDEKKEEKKDEKKEEKKDEKKEEKKKEEKKVVEEKKVEKDGVELKDVKIEEEEKKKDDVVEKTVVFKKEEVTKKE